MAFSHGTAGRGRKRYAVPGVLLNSNALAVATPADTNQNIGLTYTIPAGLLDTNGMGLRIKALWTFVGANGGKTARVGFGTVASQSVAAFTTAAGALTVAQEVLITRRSATAIDITGVHASTTTGQTNAQNQTTGVANMDTASNPLIITVQQGSAADASTLRSVTIELIPETPSPTDT